MASTLILNRGVLLGAYPYLPPDPLGGLLHRDLGKPPDVPLTPEEYALREPLWNAWVAGRRG